MTKSKHNDISFHSGLYTEIFSQYSVAIRMLVAIIHMIMLSYKIVIINIHDI